MQIELVCETEAYSITEIIFLKPILESIKRSVCLLSKFLGDFVNFKFKIANHY